MGFNVTTTAVRGKSIAKIHTILKLRPTEKFEDFPADADVLGAELPSGWYLLYFNDRRPPIEPELVELSRGGEVLQLDVCETVSASAAACWSDGRRKWSMTHDDHQYDLECTGALPNYSKAVVEKGLAAPDVFSIPVEMFFFQTGFYYDRDPEGHSGGFRILERIESPRPWWKWW